MKVKYGTAALLSLALLTGACAGTSTGGRKGGGDASYADDACTARSEAVAGQPATGGTGIRVEIYQKQSFLVGQTWINCVPSPQSHHLDIELWYQSASTGKWVTVKTATFDTIPPSGGYYAYNVLLTCAPGIYEVRWSVVGTTSLGDPYSHSTNWLSATITALDCSAAGFTPPPVEQN